MGRGEAAAPVPERVIAGRFEMFGLLASGGFAAVHLGRTLGGAHGFSKLVAIKRLHRQYVENEDVVGMFLDEARLVARVRHPNVVPIFDFVEEDGEMFLVMEYVEGVTLHQVLHDLAKKQRLIPVDITSQIITGALRGLHAAHEACDERGRSLGVIHRDVAPDNILVGIDGYARILDFGVARALGQYHATRDGEVKGKLAYMTPEQVSGAPLTRRTDVCAVATVMWQCLTGKRLFEAEHMGEMAYKVMHQEIVPPSTFNRMLPPEYDAIVLRGLERDPDKRWLTAEQMAEAIETAAPVASAGRTARWLKGAAKERLAKRAERVGAMELTPTGSPPSLEEVTDTSDGERSYKAAVTQVMQSATEKREPVHAPKVELRAHSSRRAITQKAMNRGTPVSAIHSAPPQAPEPEPLSAAVPPDEWDSIPTPLPPASEPPPPHPFEMTLPMTADPTPPPMAPWAPPAEPEPPPSQPAVAEPIASPEPPMLPPEPEERTVQMAPEQHVDAPYSGPYAASASSDASFAGPAPRRGGAAALVALAFGVALLAGGGLFVVMARSSAPAPAAAETPVAAEPELAPEQPLPEPPPQAGEGVASADVAPEPPPAVEPVAAPPVAAAPVVPPPPRVVPPPPPKASAVVARAPKPPPAAAPPSKPKTKPRSEDTLFGRK